MCSFYDFDREYTSLAIILYGVWHAAWAGRRFFMLIVVENKGLIVAINQNSIQISLMLIFPA